MRRQLTPCLSERRKQSGYVLVMVLAALALLAYMAARFAERIDDLRQQTLSIKDQAQAQTQAHSARAAALFWLATHRANPNGYGRPDGLGENWVADGRWYRLGELGWASLQDQRGLLSINSQQLDALGRLVELQGVDVVKVSRMLDVLADYADVDNLRRLNGAEQADYAALGLQGPRNDWALSVRELFQMPFWQDDPALLERVGPWLSTRRTPLQNPNTSPLPVLRAMLPGAAAQQIELFNTLRLASPFQNGAAAVRATGLPLDNDVFMYHTSDEVRLSVWAPGMPRALEYNVMLTPGGAAAPWRIIEYHTGSRPDVINNAKPPLEFPVPFYRSRAPSE